MSKPDNLIDVSDLDPALPRQAGVLLASVVCACGTQHLHLRISESVAHHGVLAVLQGCMIAAVLLCCFACLLTLLGPLACYLALPMRRAAACGGCPAFHLPADPARPTCPLLCRFVTKSPLSYQRRREVQQYKFTDDDFEICVICQLDEGVPLDQVRAG